MKSIITIGTKEDTVEVHVLLGLLSFKTKLSLNGRRIAGANFEDDEY